MSKPFSPACARNQAPILEVLRLHFAQRSRVLEVGSGTGQHAVHFAAGLPQLVWQTSDVAANLPGVRQWLAEARLSNTPAPLEFDINGMPPAATFDAVFSANTLHIMAWREVERFFAMLPGLTTADACLVVYGPFNVGGQFTSDGNAAFDASLRATDPDRGIRDLEAVDGLAGQAGFVRVEDRVMPANNLCLVWRRAAV
jgi:cyclopropane fatty-acyl-phospholipid synthase-like methyltransferase